MYPTKLLLLVSLLAIFTQFAHSQNKGYVIPSNVFYIDANVAPYNKVLPGDTLYFQAGNKDYLGIANFTGTAAKPIIMINQGGDIIIDTNHYYGIAIKNCRFIHFTGTGNPGSMYGFKVNRVAAGAGMEIGYLSSDYEIDHVSVQHTYVAGIYAKTDPDCTPKTQRTAFTQYNTIIHDNYVAYTADEGMYIGSSKYLGEPIVCNGKDSVVMPSLLDGVKVYNNIVTHTGWDGIQVGCAYRNCAIYNNTITFDSDAGVDTQMSGIMINYGTKADCYNNYISDGKGDGIDCLGLGGTRIFNNIIVNPGLTYNPGNTSLPKHGMYISDASVQKDSAFYIFNNNIINPKSEGIRFSSVLTKGNLISSNVIINPGAFDFYQNGNTSFKGIDSYVMIQKPTTTDVTQKNNYYQRTGTAAGFASANMHLSGDFALMTGSPLIDTGDTNPKAITTFDFIRQLRPSGIKSDIGTYEYQGTGVTQSGGTIASSQSLCLGSAPSAFTSAAPASGLTGTPEYKWQMSATGVAGSFTDIAGSNALTYAPGTVNTTTSFIRLARTAGSADWNAAVSSNIVTITVNPLPAASAGTDRTISPGSSTQIGATAVTGSTYSWTSSPAGFTSTSANPTVSPLVTTTYSLKETITATGCTNTHNVTVTLSSVPAAVAGANRSICQGTSTQIGTTAVTGNTYNWTSSPAGFTSTAANPIVSPTVTTTYTLTETITATGSSNS
ncbi:MAG: choice-of-anchor Q domain-containing protein, partial [Prolixibacteraceae bacterium]